MQPAETTAPASTNRQRTRLGLLLGVLVCAVAGLVFLGRPIQRWLAERTVLANEAPPPDLVAETIAASRDPRALLLAAWQSGKLLQRQGALRHLTQTSTAGGIWTDEVERLVLQAALDPDLPVRQAALSLLKSRSHPALATAATAQLTDVDPQVRQLGLDSLNDLPPAVSVPLAARLFDDADPLVVAAALKLVGRHAGQDFGLRFADLMSGSLMAPGTGEPTAAQMALASAAADRATSWWQQAQATWPPTTGDPAPAVTLPPSAMIAVADFELPTLDGRQMRLADLRGRVVLLNFWTTWCPGCVAEMPALVELARRHADRLTILGISLDAVPDEHGHEGGHEDHAGHDPDPSLEQVRSKVARFVKSRGLNYPILLDADNRVGATYGGGELPTNLLIDRQGFIRRRFIGPRSLAVFEAMVNEAGQPLDSTSPPAQASARPAF